MNHDVVSRRFDDWPSCSPAAAGISASALDAALDYAQSAGSRQVIVLHNGHRLSERYYDSTPQTQYDVYAIQKCVFSWLVGIAQHQRALSIDDSLSSLIGAGWSKADQHIESRITLRHVLTMTTGLNDALEPAGRTGIDWHYNNVVYNYAKRGLCDRVGMDLNSMTDAWITEPLGLQHTRWVERDQLLPDGRRLTGLLMTARDLARFGLAMAAGGRFGVRQVIEDQSFLREALTPGSAANPAWGYAWWINGQSHYMQAMSSRVIQGAFAPNAPADLYGGRGAMEQRVLILPSRSLVIVRLGSRAPREAGNFDDEFLGRLLGSKPEPFTIPQGTTTP